MFPSLYVIAGPNGQVDSNLKQPWSTPDDASQELLDAQQRMVQRDDVLEAMV